MLKKNKRQVLGQSILPMIIGFIFYILFMGCIVFIYYSNKSSVPHLAKLNFTFMIIFTSIGYPILKFLVIYIKKKLNQPHFIDDFEYDYWIICLHKIVTFSFGISAGTIFWMLAFLGAK